MEVGILRLPTSPSLRQYYLILEELMVAEVRALYTERGARAKFTEEGKPVPNVRDEMRGFVEKPPEIAPVAGAVAANLFRGKGFADDMEWGD